MPTKIPVPLPEEERFVAALSYVWILSLYTLLFRRNSKYIHFHAKQGVLLFALETISPIFLFLAPVVIIACVVLSVWGATMAMVGKEWKLPLVGNWLHKKTTF